VSPVASLLVGKHVVLPVASLLVHVLRPGRLNVVPCPYSGWQHVLPLYHPADCRTYLIYIKNTNERVEIQTKQRVQVCADAYVLV
jgi:hypothetical protein